MPQKLLTLLSIAGSDNIGGAGIQADIRAGSSLGLHVVTALTSVTAQNSRALVDSISVPSDMLKNQLDAIMEDIVPDAVKIGMIGSVENLNVISKFLDILPNKIPIVVDPVLYVTVSQPSLLKFELDSLEIRKGYLNDIFPKATIVTPNLDELKMLTGETIPSALTLVKLHAKAAVIKGGHAKKDQIEDNLLIGGEKMIKVSHPRINCHNLHGTGCVYSSFIASYLALGFDIKSAFQATERKMQTIINKSCFYDLGISSYGPLNINENYQTGS